MENKRNKFRISKWICFSFAVLMNGFIIVYSCLSNETTKQMARPFASLYTAIVNNIFHKEVEVKPLEKIELSIPDTYKYNNLLGYEANEIPLGSEKKIDCSFYPIDATDKSITYEVSPLDSAIIKQSDSSVSVIGMKPGMCVVSAKSNNCSLSSTITMSIVETVAPTSFEISLDNTEIKLNTTETINIDIDGGVLKHDELINFRYYDTRKLQFSSSNEDVATINEYGVISPKSVGNSTITVSNKTISKAINISVVGSVTPPIYTNLLIDGSSVCYANDMILDQKSNNYHYQLTPKDGENALNPDDFIWESSNELLTKVDKHGVVRGFRKASTDDEIVKITAISKVTGDTVSMNMIVKNQLPTSFNYCLILGEKGSWDKNEYSLTVGDNIVLFVEYDVPVYSNQTAFSSSDNNLISITEEGNQATLHILKEGTCYISIRNTFNESINTSFKCEVFPSGVISSKDMASVETSIRKSIGHSAVFMVAQIFTYLTLYMFFYEKKWWFYSSISLGEGLFLAGLSELIQFFVPTRSGSFIDVLIDFAGVAVGAALTFLGIYLVKKIIEKRKQKENNK